jgi:tetratricopeptide (TPR) repeat protein
LISPPSNKLSHTSSKPELREGKVAFHNLPELDNIYIERVSLENRLKEVLVDNKRRVITLHGRGGAGKTSLALKIARKIVDGEITNHKYDVVIWLSARNVDLLETGPTEVKRDIRDIKSVAEFILKTVGEIYGDDPLQKLSEYLGNSENRVLVVLDNFETINNPIFVHNQFEEMLAFPNKVLITSRVYQMQRDYPIEVHGMEDTEAIMLIEAEFKQHGMEKKFNSTIAKKVISITGAIPYLMKVSVALLRNNVNIDFLQNKLLSDEDLAEKLFRSSYEPLNEEEKYVFLLASCLTKELNFEIIAGFIAVNRQASESISSSEVYQIIQSIKSRSLLIEQASEDVIWYTAPVDAKNFGKKELEKSIFQAEVKSARDMYQRYFPKLSHQASRALILNEIEKYSKKTYDKGTIVWLDSFMTGISSIMIEVKRLVAFYRLNNRSFFDHRKVQDGFEEAIAYFPEDTDLRIEYSKFAYFDKRDIKLSFNQLIEVLRIDKSNIKIAIDCAQRFNEYIKIERESGRNIASNQKHAMSELIIQSLQQAISANNAKIEVYSQLYWIFMNRGRVNSAFDVLEKGIEAFPTSGLLFELRSKHRANSTRDVRYK